MSDSETTPNKSGGAASPDQVSLLFWISLVTAGLIYAAVALSPKLVEWIRTRQEYVTNYERMVQLEREITLLETVARTLETDPQFAAEVHRHNFLRTQPAGSELPPVLLSAAATDIQNPPSALPWYHGPAATFAANSRLRTGSLIAAALLVLIAFTVFIEPAAPAIGRAGSAIQQAAARLASRYRAAPASKPSSPR